MQTEPEITGDLSMLTAEGKASEDAALVAKLKKGAKRVAKAVKGDDTVLFARSTHYDPKTKKTATKEFRTPRRTPRIGPVPSYYTKTYVVRPASEDGEVPELTFDKTFGPYTTNRAQRRATTQFMMRLLQKRAERVGLRPAIEEFNLVHNVKTAKAS